MAGWFFAGPALLLIVVFLILPFFMAVGFSFTNQRLVSPNPTEFVGTRNYERLFGMAILTLDAKRDADSQVIMKQGEPEYPRLRFYTRNKAEFPQYHRKREWFHINLADDRRLYVLATDVVFLKAVTNTLFFVLLVAPIQAVSGSALPC